jgi:diguanylate cyclase (GGDEF)-like protein/PAS domain S-box-containing protein
LNLLSYLDKLIGISFNDTNLEKRYQKSYLQEHIPQNILAAKISIIIYLFYAPLTYSLILDEALLLTVIVLFSMTMPFFLIFKRESTYFLKYENFFLYASSLVAGLGPVLFYVFTQNDRAMFQVDVLIPLIVIFTMYGVGFSLALLSMVSIITIFLTLAVALNLPTFDIFMAIYTMLIGGVVSGVAGYLIEKSQRKLFVSKLESDEFKYLIDNSHDLISIYDIKTHKYLYANNAVLKINNYTFENILTKKVTQVHPELTTEVVDYMFQQLNEKEKMVDVIKLSKESGEEYYVHTTLQYGFYKSRKVIISLSTDITEIKHAELQIQEMAMYDSLTKLYNRYKLDEYMVIQINNYKRYKEDFSFLICDIDHFKKVNDTYGHSMGDIVLKRIADEIKKNIRENDLVARWGGEEFAILLPKTTLDEAIEVAKKIHTKVRSIEHEKVGNVYISCGVTSFKENDTQLSIFNRVDSALYEAKNNGRDQICAK